MRDFFTFDLGSLHGSVTSATLELRRSDNQSAAPTFSLFDVSTDPATLNNNTGTSAAIYNDLGTGTSYGVFRVPNGGADDVLKFSLNAAGLADIQRHAGGFFSIGGSVLGGYLFGGSSGIGVQRLVVTTGSAGSPTPEPATLSLFAAGALLAGAGRRRTRG
jgi:hypothetical protein